LGQVDRPIEQRIDGGGHGLLPGARPQTVAAAVDPLLDRSVDLTKWGMHKRASEVDRYYMTPFRDVRLTSEQYGGMTPAGSWTDVYGLLAIALLIVLVAGCNFMNIDTAQPRPRSGEVHEIAARHQ